MTLGAHLGGGAHGCCEIPIPPACSCWRSLFQPRSLLAAMPYGCYLGLEMDMWTRRDVLRASLAAPAVAAAAEGIASEEAQAQTGRPLGQPPASGNGRERLLQIGRA